MIMDYIHSLHSPWNALVWVGLFLAVFIVCILITKLSNAIFKRIQRRHPGLHVMFLHHILTILIIIGFILLVVSTLAGVKQIWSTIFGGTAIISAVLAFAAQDINKDVLAGMMISAHNPYRVGDRITLEDGTTGVVEDLTLNHTVLRSVESLRYVIPNSKMNAMRLTNYNYKTNIRSTVFKFSVGYDSDMSLVKKVIAKAVEESPYSIKGHVNKDGEDCYGDVYFMAFADSALIIQTTVYYRPSNPGEKVIDDVNVRVREALIANNIEIPYNYVNVVDKPESKPVKKVLVAPKAAPIPAKAPVLVAKPVAAPAKAPVSAVKAPVTAAKPVTVAKTPVTATKAPVTAAKAPVKTVPVKVVAKPVAKPVTKPVVKTVVKPVAKPVAKPPVKK